MHKHDLPQAQPHLQARRITAAEVLALQRRETVPGIEEADPRVQSIRRCRLNVVGHITLSDALREGYLYVNGQLHMPDQVHSLQTLWSWWCTAAGHPEIVLLKPAASDAARIRVDLSPTGQRWGYEAWRTLGRMLYMQQPVDDAGWLFTPDELQLDGLEMEEAITIARGLVDVCTAGRFRPQQVPPPAEEPVRPPRFGHQTRMERSDQ